VEYAALNEVLRFAEIIDTSIHITIALAFVAFVLFFYNFLRLKRMEGLIKK